MDAVQALLSLVLGPSDEDRQPRAIRRLSRQSNLAWTRAFTTLEAHRVDLLVTASLSEHHKELWTRVPTVLRERMEAKVAAARHSEILLRLALNSAGSALASAQITPVVCKGIILAMDYYPGPGQRPMQDVDLWIERPKLEAAVEVLRGEGFECELDWPHTAAWSCTNQWGALFDVHGEMTLFEARGLTIHQLSHAHDAGSFRVFRPEAQLVHLVVHMLGHTDEAGLMLGWLVDLVMVLRKRAEELDWTLVRRLFPPDGSWLVFLRMLAVFGELGWLSPPPHVAHEVSSVRPIAWGMILRQRRLAPWELPALRGWMRWGKASVLGHSAATRQYPWPTRRDLALWPLDWLRERTTLVHGSGAVLVQRAYHFEPGTLAAIDEL